MARQLGDVRREYPRPGTKLELPRLCNVLMGSRESAMAFHFEDQAAREKLIGNFSLAVIAAVVFLILYKGVMMF
jgi:hypothetical protein